MKKIAISIIALLSLNACQTTGYAGNKAVKDEAGNIVNKSIIGDVRNSIADAVKQGSGNIVRNMVQ